MPNAIVVTPVKDSLQTTKQTIEAIAGAKGSFEYYVFNDYSTAQTKHYLNNASNSYGFTLIHLEDITDTPSPNYRLVLQMAQKIALEKNCHLLIIESDVVIEPTTIEKLVELTDTTKNAGMIGAITVDKMGNYNFPYTFEKNKSNEVIKTEHSLSFCCTLLTNNFLKEYNFRQLSDKKDWFDIYISRQSAKMGFANYLAKGIEVLHLPHSSRPWKNLKYKNPVLYYLKKYFYKRDRI
jgi:GT2 family glycosyltransferase